MKKFALYLFLIGLLSGKLCAQDIPIGTWRTHHSYQNGRILVATPSKLFCAVSNGLFSLDLEDKNIHKITKVSGLSDAQISAMHYDDEAKLLAIGYTSGMVDLIYENKISNIQDYKALNRDVDKTIFDLEVHDGLVYAATNIGVLVISLKENAILDNFASIGVGATDVSVLEVLEAEGMLYALTSDGVQVGSLSQNLLDFNNWTRYRLDSSHTFSAFTSANGVHFIHNDTLVSKLVADTLSTVAAFVSPIRNLHSDGNSLNVLLSNEYHQITGGTTALVQAFAKVKNASDLVIVNEVWVADGELGLVDASEKSWNPNGPLNDDISNLKVDNETVYAFYGPKPESYEGSFDNLGYNTFLQATWNYTIIPNFYNLTDVATYRGKRYFSSAGAGLYIDGEDEVLDASNSILSQNIDKTGTHISTLTVGRSLWAFGYDHSVPLFELNRDGEWKAYSSSEIGTSKPIAAEISEEGVLWINRGEGNLSYWDSFDGALTTISSSRGLPSSIVNDIALSVKDKVWLATTAGLVGFEDASFIGSGEIAFPLLYENEDVYKDLEIKAIATDGGGRVWVAGRDHLAVYNASLTKRAFFFTESNSPLLSNDILEMEYHPVTGEMFILTSKGLVSYRSNSSVATDLHQNVKIFPNPVRPGYTGLVGITGLAADVDVKITDINGKLMQRVTAEGGTASWNLRDYNNNSVRSGIYLVLSATDDGEETHIGKIAIVE